MNVKDLVGRCVVGLHRGIVKVTGGKVLGDVSGMPVLEVVTTGAKSGQKRAAMLTSPVKYEGNYVVVASRGGDVRHPGWFHNMKAHPEVQVTYKGRTANMTARVMTDAERTATWPEVVAKYKGYGGYQEKTDRTIPLIVLEGQL